MRNFLKFLGLFISLVPFFGMSTYAQTVEKNTEKQRVLFQARLSADSPVIPSGVEWRVFLAKPNAEGDLPELAQAVGGSKAFDMEPGEYLVHAAYGHAGAVKKISIGDEPAKEEFIMNAGGLRLSATASGNVPIPERMLTFDIYDEEISETGDRKLHMTGQVAWDGDGQLIGAGDCETQVRQCFDNVEHILNAVGGRFEDIVSLTIYFLNSEDLPAIQKVRAEKFSPDTAPASILIQTPGLVSPDLLVELVPVAIIPDDRYQSPQC